MKTHEEMTHDVFQRINEYKEAQKKKRRIITRTATSICSLCLIALLGISVWHSGIWNTAPITVDPNTSNVSGELKNPQGNSSATDHPSNTDNNNTTPSRPSQDPPDNNTSTQNPIPSEPSNPNTENPSGSSDPNTPSVDNPLAVHQGQKVTYEQAKTVFNHPIKECTASTFCDYIIGIVSQTGNHDGSEKTTCLDITYRFSNGTIIITDQDRMGGGYLYAELEQQINYKDRIFMVETNFADEGNVRISYYPTNESGLAYTAIFSSQMDQYEILDLIVSLEI